VCLGYGHQAAQLAEQESARAAWRGWDLVWCQPNGQPIDTRDDWDEWKALLAEARFRSLPRPVCPVCPRYEKQKLIEGGPGETESDR
jgi:hypothetical protein